MKPIKSLFFSFFFGLIIFGCSEGEIPKCKIDQVVGDPESVIGTWQLVSKKYINQETGVDTIIDFSCDGVFYTFLANGNFLVSGSHPEMPNFSSNSYEFKYGEITDGAPSNSSLRLSNSTYPCLLEDDQMIIDKRYVDGQRLVFYRVKGDVYN